MSKPQKRPLGRETGSFQLANTHKKNGTYKVCAVVASKSKSKPMLTAAIICTAQPQSTLATLAMLLMVLASKSDSFRNIPRKVNKLTADNPG